MSATPSTATMFLPGTTTKPTDSTQTQVTEAFDCLQANNAGFQFTLAGATGTISDACTVETSNAVPPNGLYASKFPRAGGLGTYAWQPPESSWIQCVDGSGNPASSTLTTNDTTAVQVYAPFLLRWVRAKWTPAAGSVGGQVTVEVFVRSPGDA